MAQLFTMGLGYIYNSKRILSGIGFICGSIAITYEVFNVKPLGGTLFNIMFADEFFN
jgi:hypothetical protein